MAGSGQFWGFIQNLVNSGGVAQPAEIVPSAPAASRMRRQNVSRTKRLRMDDANDAKANQRIERVGQTSLESARAKSAAVRLAERERQKPPDIVREPASALPGEHSRRGAYEAYSDYLSKLRGATEWNRAVQSYGLPLPTVNLNPVADDFKSITHDPYYAASPQEALRYNTPGESNYSKKFDTTYMGENPILSKTPVYIDKDMFGAPIPVSIGGQNPFELTPSPYSVSDFLRRLRATPNR